MTNAAPEQSRHFVALLTALLLLFVAAPIGWLMEKQFQTTLIRWFMIIVLMADLLVAARLAAHSKGERVLAWLLAVPATIGFGASLATASPLIHAIAEFIAICFLLVIVITLLRFVFRAKKVTGNTVAAALCAYLCICIAYASLYTLLYIIDADSFAFSNTLAAMDSSAESFSVVALYYSLVTMTTLGYGDIAPTTPVTQMAAAIQALIGQLYLAVLIARLVGIQVSNQQQS